MALMLGSSCSNTRYLRRDQALLVDQSIRIRGNLLPSEKEDIRNNLNSTSILEQQPNFKTLLVARAGLWLYNRYDSTRRSSRLLGWLINKSWLKPPVIYDSILSRKTAINMENYLVNQGYFHTSVGFQTRVRKQKAVVTYQVNTGTNFLVDSISYDIPDTNILRLVRNSASASFLQLRHPYKTQDLLNERDRITQLLKDKGYFRFSSDNVLFEVDTTNRSFFRTSLNPFESILNVFNAEKSREKPTLGITLIIRPSGDSLAFERYKIRDIWVYPDFPLNGTIADSTLERKPFSDFTLLFHRDLFRPQVLSRNIFLKPGQWYDHDLSLYTQNRLTSLGEWKFVTIQYQEVAGDTGMLDCYFLLVPEKRQEVSASLEETTGSDYQFGSGLGLTYQDRNVNRAANLLTLSLRGGLELDSTLRVQAQEFDGQANLNFPRFIVPRFIHSKGIFSNAKTNLGIGFNFMKRLNYYKFQNNYASLGYDWNETPRKSWIVKPFFLSFNKYGDFSPRFQAEIDSNTFLRNSFQSVFLEGENLTFIWNTQQSPNQLHYDFFRTNLEEAGLLLKGIDGLLRGITGNRNNFQKLTSLKYSRYVKIDAEFKHYYNLPHASLVSRLYGGIAIPFGGNPVVPYIKQFFAGGPNSIRAWHLRTLGPGSYQYNPSSSVIFVDQTGEMKLEANLEYRFDILQLFGGASLLKGALFTDAGNIWDIHSDPSKPGSAFHFNTLYQDLAVGSGIGLRLDFTYFLIRLDMAVPMKDPSVFRNYGWVPDGFRPFNWKWLGNNLVVNFAVGYPF